MHGDTECSECSLCHMTSVGQVGDRWVESEGPRISGGMEGGR